MTTNRGTPSRPRVIAQVGAVVAFDLFTWFVFSLGCSLGELDRPAGDEPCGTVLMALPGIGAVMAIIGAIFALTPGDRWPRGRRRPLHFLIVVGIAAGGVLWILYGDPAGNFGGALGGA